MITSFSWNLQVKTANIIGGIPKGFKVVELDVTDGKNVFYMPNNIDYTAVMPSSLKENDIKKKNNKFSANEQLILECIGKVNR